MDGSTTPASSQRRPAILDTVRHMVAQFLHREPSEADLHVPLLDMGANSLTHMELARSVEKAFGVKVAVRQFFSDIGTIDELAGYIDAHMPREAEPVPPVDAVPASPSIAAPALAVRPVFTAGANDLEAVFAEQIRAVSDAMAGVVAQQLAFLGGGAAPSIPVSGAAPVKPAPVPPAPPKARPVSVLPPFKVQEIRARGLTPRQQASLEALIERYNRRTASSKRLTQAGRPVLADNRASAGFRFTTKEMLYPLMGVRSAGSRMWDIDGNEYVDITMGFGANFFGHQPPFIVDAIREQLAQGMQIGPQTALAAEVAWLFRDVTGMERVALCNTGTEAVMAALRLARVFTGRDRIAVFEGSYHGHFDGVVGVRGDDGVVPLAPGIAPNHVKDLLILDYGDPASLDTLRAHAGEVAAILVEPVQSRRPELQPREFLKNLRAVTRELGILLVFDEMICGFRLHQGGAQAWFGVDADLATYGKILGGGMPIGAVGGRAEIMDGFDGGFWNYGDDSYPTAEQTFFAGTFNKHPLAMAAAKVVLTRLRDEGPGLQERVNALTSQMARRLNDLFRDEEVPITLSHCGSQFRFAFTGNMDILFFLLPEKGLFIWEGRNCFLSAAHTQEDVDFIVRVVGEAIEDLRGGGFLPERPGSAWRIPVIEAQRQLWLQARLEGEGSHAYAVTTALELTGALDVENLRQAVGRVVARHDALRATFTADGAFLRVTPAKTLEWSGEAEDATFDLTTGPLFRARLNATGPDRHELVLAGHHSIIDGWSMGVLVDEIGRLYSDPGADLGEPVSFEIFARWQRLTRDGEAMAAHEAFWRERLANPPVLELPTDRARPPVKTFRGLRRTTTLDPVLVEGLVRVAKGGGATLFMILLAAYTALLHRLTGQDDVIVGIPIANRSGVEGGERIVGYLTHLLPVRCRIDGTASVKTFLGTLRDTLLDAYEHEEYPFARLLDRLELKRDPSRSPLLSTVFNLDRPVAPPAFKGLAVTAAPRGIAHTAYDFGLNVLELDSGVVIECDVNADLFDGETAERVLEHYRTLLEAFVTDAQTTLADLPLMDEAARAAVLRLGVGAVRPRDERRVHRLFEAQAARTPEAVALIGGETLSYAELDARANRLAHVLIGRGARPETLVALALPHTTDAVVSVLAVLKAGAAYLPLDPDYPADRQAFMLKDAAPRIIVTRGGPAFPADGIERVDLANLPDAPAAAPDVAVKPDSLAYVLYTSGSTGQPKGVEVEHRNLANLALAHAAAFELRAGDRFLQFASLSFDIASGEIATALAAGAAVVLPDSRLPGEALTRLMAERKVTHAEFSASVLAALPFAPLPDLRVVITGGEPCPAEVAARWAKGRKLFNAYGPTEATVCVTGALYAGVTPTPIGRPFDNVEVRVVDARLNPVPVGVLGEIVIGGAAVARGYRGRPDLTAASFVADPLGGGRLYRTGDLGRWRADGQLEFHGRADGQVKVRGIRFELGEIEAVLEAHPGVRQAAAAVHDERVVAYIVGSAANDALLDTARQRLPAALVPQAVVRLDSLPLTPNGKLDRRALPAPQRTVETTAPRSELERTLTALWADVLKLETVGIQANFFDLGGHSLTLTELHGRLEKALGRTLPIVDLFRFPTVASLAAHLGDEPEVQAAPERPLVPASGAIAIIGLAGRFPKAPDAEAFWLNLRDGVDSITTFTDDELIAVGVDPALVARPDYVKARGVLENADLFDAAFFGITPREADEMDPQHRLLLETAWEALENAGCDPRRATERIGVYAGVGLNTYLLSTVLKARGEVTAEDMFGLSIGNDKDFAPTRIAYKLGLRGPALSINTACSTSLVAVQTACQALLSGQCDMALAGGAAVPVPQVLGYLHQDGSIDSPDGRCRPFDASARGTVSGAGAGLVVLKRLEDALADGDAIRAVIKGAAINNDGAQKVGYTAPSVEGQARVIGDALARAGVDPRTIDYVEAHGTATELGDPIEVAALTQAFRAAGDRRTGACALGSVKALVGHLDAAAGVAGLIKTVLALEHGELPPSPHFTAPNPKIDFANSPFAVHAERRAWPKRDRPRRAGVSSFGIGGTNAHVVVEEAPETVSTAPGQTRQLLVLSARSPQALDTATANLARWLRARPDLDLANVAWTLQTGRAEFAWRRAVVVENGIDALDTPPAPVEAAEAPPPVAFLFPGQGSQYPGMARDLYDGEPVFRDALDACAAILRKSHGLDLLAALDGDAERLNGTDIAQPVLFAVSYALVQLWRAWGIEPQALAGHSLGEYVAAHLAGVFSLEDALTLVAERGRLMAAQPSGAMMAVTLGENEVRPLLAMADGVALAAINGPERCVVSGPEGAIGALETALAARGVGTRRLHTSHAFHSPMMEPAARELVRLLAGMTLSPPQKPFLSNLTGTWITAAEATDPEYWARHLLSPVRFADNLAELLADPARIVIEAGPANTLVTFAAQHPACGKRPVLASLPHPHANRPAVMLDSLGRLWMAGVPVDWAAVHRPARRRKVALPAYPFERRRHWLDAVVTVKAPAAGLDAWFHHVVWRDRPLAATTVAPKPTWLLLGEDGPLAAALAKALRAAGQDIISGTPADGERLILGAGAGATVVYLAPGETNGFTAYHHAVAFAGVLARRGGGSLVLVTERAHDLSGAEDTDWQQAALTPLAHVVAQEHPGIGVRAIDIAGPAVRAAEGLAAELLSGGGEPVVALRGRRRWVPVIERTSLPAGATLLKRGGTYLVTGATGRIGRVLSHHLAMAWDAKLVLVGRSAEERETASTLEIKADAADEAAMAVVFRRAEARFGHVDGVFLLAGVSGAASFNPVADSTAATAAPHLRAKIDGARVLDRLLTNRLPDFVVSFSSLAGIAGGVGLADYAATSAALDAFAQRRNRDGGVPWITIDWDAWAEAGGLGASMSPVAIGDGEGMAALERILAAPPSGPVVVTKDDPAQRLARRNRPADTRNPPAATAGGTAAPEGETETRIAAVWEAVLGIHPIGRDDGFFALGGDSLSAVQAVSRLKAALRVDLTVRDLFENPTVAAMARRTAGDGQDRDEGEI